MSHVVLVGMMGSGKSTVGRVLADRLGWAFVDADDEIARRAGRSVPEIFATLGEPAFRALEAEVLTDALEAETASVVAAGGGAVLDASVRERLARRATVVWLRASPSVLVSRLGGGVGRPLLSGPGDLDETVARLDEQRAPLYQEVAGVTVDVGDRTPDQVAELLVEELRQVTS